MLYPAMRALDANDSVPAYSPCPIIDMPVLYPTFCHANATPVAICDMLRLSLCHLVVYSRSVCMLLLWLAQSCARSIGGARNVSFSTSPLSVMKNLFFTDSPSCSPIQLRNSVAVVSRQVLPLCSISCSCCSLSASSPSCSITVAIFMGLFSFFLF